MMRVSAIVITRFGIVISRFGSWSRRRRSGAGQSAG